MRSFVDSWTPVTASGILKDFGKAGLRLEVRARRWTWTKNGRDSEWIGMSPRNEERALAGSRQTARTFICRSNRVRYG